MGKIKVGDKIPQFRLLNQDGKQVNIIEYFGRPLVIFFYPKDDTPGCTKEVCAFRDSYEKFIHAEVQIFGISGDSVNSHQSFRSKYNLQFDLLSDTNNEIRSTFGVPADLFGLIPGRVTYIVDPEGIVRYIFNNQLNSKKHVEESLRIIKNFKPIKN